MKTADAIWLTICVIVGAACGKIAVIYALSGHYGFALLAVCIALGLALVGIATLRAVRGEKP